MFDQHSQKRGLEFAENMFGDATRPFVHMPMTFPEFEQQLDLPSRPIQEQDLLGLEQGSWNIGHDQVPVSECEG